MRSPSASASAAVPRPFPLAFGLLSALLALLVMHPLGTPRLDLGVYRAGVCIAGGVGASTGWLLVRLRETGRWRRSSGWLVPLAGGLVGVLIQTLLLIRDPHYQLHVRGLGLSTRNTAAWVLGGLPLGALAALVLSGVLAVTLRLVSAPAHDAAERWTTPFAAATALVGALALGAADRGEIPLVLGIIFAALTALAHVALADAARARWLRSVFEGEVPGFEVVPAEEFPSVVDAPPVVGAVLPHAVIVQIEEAQQGYRAAARVAFATTGIDLYFASRPLLQRRAGILATLAVTAVITAIALSLR